MSPSSSKTSSSGEPITRFWQKIALVAEISSACRNICLDRPDFSEVLELLQQIIPFDAATLMLRDPSTGRFRSHDQLVQPVPPPRQLLGHIIDRIAREHTSAIDPEVVVPADRPDEFDPAIDFTEVMCVPLVVDERVIGLLNLGSYVAGVLAPKHLKLMKIVGDQLGVSIERLYRMAEIEARNRSLEEAQRRLRANQERLIASEKLAAVADLAATINHQINNPLSVIVGQVQCMLLQDDASAESTRERLFRIELAALRIGDVNRRLLNIDDIVSAPGPGELVDRGQCKPSTKSAKQEVR